MNRTCTKPMDETDLRLFLIICWVTVKWETDKACSFKIKTWKWHQKAIKICSGNPKFFWSFIYNPFYPVAISWHYPFKEAEVNSLTPSGKSWSDWAENFTVASLIYLKKLMFYALILSRTFYLWKFLTVHCSKTCCQTISYSLASWLRSS